MENKIHNKVRPIILIMSCLRDVNNGNNEACRETWLGTWKNLIEYRFFLGTGNSKQYEDEVLLDCGDGYTDLPYKVCKANKWALENNYTHTFKCDTDTYVHIPRLLASEYTRSSYIGHVCRNWYCAGGAGYWLSSSALELVSDSRKYHDAEDLNTAQCLRTNGILPVNDSRYTLWDEQDYGKGRICSANNDIISIHLTYSPTAGQYNKETMYTVHASGKIC